MPPSVSAAGNADRQPADGQRELAVKVLPDRLVKVIDGEGLVPLAWTASPVQGIGPVADINSTALPVTAGTLRRGDRTWRRTH